MKTLVVMLALLATSGAWAAPRIIRLTDGSRILGDVVSMQNDSFTVKTRDLGTVTIKATQIESMTKPGDAPATQILQRTNRARTQPAAKDQAIKSIRSGIVNNTALMGDILRLQSDPQMKAVLADPQLMKAVKSLNFDKLSNDPKIKALMNNPTIQAISSHMR